MFNSDLTKHLAELSKLEFTDEELEQMTADMTNIIAIMDKVCEFDTSKPAYALDAVDYKDLRADEHREIVSLPKKLLRMRRMLKITVS